MARAFLSKSHLLRFSTILNHNTKALTFLLSPNNFSKFQPTLFLSPHSSNDFHRTFCTGPNQSASVDSPLMQSMEKKIKEQLNADSVTVKDAYGDGRHVSISVISAAFEGQNTVNRQRMVYKAIWEELQDSVHAVHQMITRTPAEAKT